ncbi:MAG: hypothetical protein Kow0069_22530 [Promethearchaeota archaeon]
MSKAKFSTLLLFVVLVGVASPAFRANAQVGDGGLSLEDPAAIDQALGGALGAMREMSGGETLANVLSLILGQMFEGVKEEKSTLPGTYVFHATETKTQTFPAKEVWSDFEPGTWEEVLWGWELEEAFNYYLTTLHPELGEEGIPYAVINRTVGDDINITYTIGVDVTVILYDADESFINAVSRIIRALEAAANAQNDQEAMEQLVGAFSYFLIHINDVITGDELLVINPTHFENIVVEGTYGEEHLLYYVNSTDSRIPIPGDVVAALLADAQAAGDKDLEWVINGGVPLGVHKVGWSTFSFDLLQLWMKRFHLEIDFGPLTEAINEGREITNPFEIFKGMDVEFYFVSHHLVNPVLYNDTNDNHLIDVWYTNLTYPNGTVVTVEDSSGKTPVKKILSEEVKYVLGLKSVDPVNPWTTTEPTVTTGEDGRKQIQWGVSLNNPNITWVPVWVDDESWAWSHPTQQATIDHISLGFTFVPGENIQLNDTETGEPTGMIGKDVKIKLDQEWGAWSDVPAELDGLDLSVVFVSTLLHFRFNVEAGVADEISQEKLLQGNETYEQAEGYFTFGRDAYVKDDTGEKNPMLGKVDIAGPDYQQYEKDDTSTLVGNYSAQTQIIPWALFEGRAKAGETRVYTDNQQDSYSVDAFVQLDVSAMLYAVNYYSFDGTGDYIVHDPTFSMFLTFPEESVIAIIVIFAVVALVGVAAVLITRAKDNR